MCTHIEGTIDRPMWRIAHRTSAREKVRFFMWSGCVHAATIRDTVPTSDPECWTATEAAWDVLRAELFKRRCSTWNNSACEQFARRLAERPFAYEQVGVTNELSLDIPGIENEQRTNED